MMPRSKVVFVRGKNIIDRNGEPDSLKLRQIFTTGISLLADKEKYADVIQHMFNPEDRVGIKVNTIAGKSLSTKPEVALSLARLLTESGIRENNLLIWDRTNRELKSAGYPLNMSRTGIKIFATDSQNIGYDPYLTTHSNIGSLYSSIQSRWITSSVSLAILKDHGLAGITAGMKNYYGAIHNPNKYHDFNCNPYIPELFESDPISSKHRISILDCLTVQYHRGPSFHPQWAETMGAIILSKDPVAADFIGWQIIERLRAKKGLPSLKEEKREPLYLRTAEKFGLGNARANRIDLIEEVI